MIGYVDELKEDLFNLTKLELYDVQESMAKKYKSKIPASLSSQFSDRINKKEAVDKYHEKKEREATRLHPVGKIWTQVHTCNSDGSHWRLIGQPLLFEAVIMNYTVIKPLCNK